MPVHRPPGMTVDLTPVTSNGSVKFDLGLILIPHSVQRLGLPQGDTDDGHTIIWEYNTGYEAQMPLSFYDITGDGIPEVFGINDEMKLSILNGKKGEPIYEKFLQEENSQSKIILADFNGNGFLNLVTSGGRGEYLKILEIPNVNVPKNSIIYAPRW